VLVPFATVMAKASPVVAVAPLLKTTKWVGWPAAIGPVQVAVLATDGLQVRGMPVVWFIATIELIFWFALWAVMVKLVASVVHWRWPSTVGLLRRSRLLAVGSPS
jgi:hypothetical protein